MTSGLKRNRIGLPLTKPDFPAPCSIGTSDFGESLGLRKVLQGQEKSGFHSACDGNGNPRHFISEPGRYYPSCVPPDDYGIKSRTGFEESFRPLKVLQGQEIHPAPVHIDRRHEPFPTQVFEGVRVSSYGNGERWIKAASNSDFLTQVPSPSSLLMYQHKMMSMEHMTYPMKGRDEVVPRVRPSCRLFGFSLTEGEHMMDPKRKLNSLRPSIYPATTFWPLIEGQPYYKSPSVTKVVGSNCPGGNNLYAVRDMLLDIAL